MHGDELSELRRRVQLLEAQVAERDRTIRELKATCECKAEYAPEDEDVPERIRHLSELRVSQLSDITMEHGGLAGQILDALPVQIYVKDSDRRYTYLNAAAMRRMNYPEVDPIGHVSDDVLQDKELAAKVRMEDERSLRTPRAVRAVEHWTDNSGRYRTNIALRFRIVNHANDVVGTVSVASDERFEESARTTEAIVELLVHDWVSGLLESLHDKLQNLLYWKSRSESYSQDERREADELLRLAREGDPHPTRLDEGMTGERFNGWVGHTFIPIHFMEGYLRFLRWYLGDPSFMKRNHNSSRAPFNLRFACLKYMDTMFAFLRGDVGNGPQRPALQWSIDYQGVPSDVDLNGDVHLFRMLVMEMARNHNKYGRPHSQLPLVIATEQRGSAVELRFFSAGVPLTSDTGERERLWKRGERGEDHTDPRRQAPGAGFGLFFCDRIAMLHGGERWIEVRDDEGFRGNVFVFRFPEVDNGDSTHSR